VKILLTKKLKKYLINLINRLLFKVLNSFKMESLSSEIFRRLGTMQIKFFNVRVLDRSFKYGKESDPVVCPSDGKTGNDKDFKGSHSLTINNTEMDNILRATGTWLI